MTNDDIRFQEDVSVLFTKYGIDSSQKPLGEQKTNEIIRSAVHDYFAKVVSANQLESLGTQLYYKLNDTSEINTKWSQSLSNVLQRLIDFGYYVENSDDALVRKIEGELKKFSSKESLKV